MQQAQQAPPNPVDVFGGALGLHSDFLNDVKVRGTAAIIDRAEAIDVTGAHGRLLALARHVGAYLDSIAAKGKKPDPVKLAAATAMSAHVFRVAPDLAMRLVGGALDIMEHTASVAQKGLMMQAENANTDAQEKAT